MQATVHTLPTSAPGTCSVHALHAYADRLARCRQRLEDDVQAAYTRLDWAQHEAEARRVLLPVEVRTLVDAGVLAPIGSDPEDHRIIERRRAQLAAVTRVEELTRDAIDRHQRSSASNPGRAMKER
jgi:hypothetical protein